MFELCDEATQLNSSGEPTSLLDLGFTNVPHLFKNRATVSSPISTSDHLPVVFRTCLKQKFNTPQNRSYVCWLYPRKNHERMMSFFSFDNWTQVLAMRMILTLYGAVGRVNSFFKWHLLYLVCSSKVEKSQETTMVQQLFHMKNRLFKRARSSRLPEQWAIYRSARNKATKAIKMAKANHFNCMASSLANPKCPPSKWWNIARDMCGLKGHSSNIVPPLKGNYTVFDNIDKANILNDTFINQNTSTALENFPFGPTQTKAIFTIYDDTCA